jgi:hypothetical protein
MTLVSHDNDQGRCSSEEKRPVLGHA